MGRCCPAKCSWFRAHAWGPCEAVLALCAEWNSHMCCAVIARAALVYDAAVAGDDLVLGWSGRADTLFFLFVFIYGSPLQDYCLENPMDRGAW